MLQKSCGMDEVQESSLQKMSDVECGDLLMN